MTRLPLLLLISMVSFAVLGQRAKEGNYTTSAANETLNTYTYLTANATAGGSSITVNDNVMNGGVFSGPLAQGDLVMVIQMQGAAIKIADWVITSWGVTFTLPNDSSWGVINNYNNCGKYEFREVSSIGVGGVINLNCALSNTYTATGHVQVVRVPRFDQLTVQSGHSITAPAWDGASGGIVALEVDGTTTLDGDIITTGLGFRGGQVNAVSSPVYYGSSFWGSYDPIEGGEKGEGIFGFYTELDARSSRYCKGAPGNGGGGATNHNAGGGGGANANAGGTYSGKGVPDPAYAAAWAGEYGGPMPSSNGGGRGGYSNFANNLDPASVPPGDGAWGGDNRRLSGGLGGHALDYSSGRIFFGGGGGAGDANDEHGGSGGSGGGIVFLQTYGDVNGSGSILAEGDPGEDAAGPAPNPFSGDRAGDDGAGGGGGGGVVMLRTVGTVSSSINISADGGDGGWQQMVSGAFISDEADGPGGGGGGGYVAVSNGTPTTSANGGAYGQSTASTVGSFLANGATSGAVGLPGENVDAYDLQLTDVTLCGGASTTLTVTVVGTLPAGGTIGWYDAQFGGNLLGTGTTYNTGALASNTAYWVGLCPEGSFRVPVNVNVSNSITISGSAVVTDQTCAGNDGSITGLTASGGLAPLIFDWNGDITLTEDTVGIAAGPYTLTVTDQNGCTATSGPYFVGSAPGPNIDTTSYSITDATCYGNDGSVTGIVANGASPFTFAWNGVNSPSEELTGASAGSYTLVVTDVNGCSDSTWTYVIGTTSDPVIDDSGISITDAACTAASGTISGITVSGVGPFTHDWNGGVSTTADTSGVPGGNFTYTVTDLGTGCSATSGPYSVGVVSSLSLDAAGLTVTPTGCAADDGTITGIVVNGVSPYQYWWNGISATGPDTIGVGQGTYELLVTDANGCSDSVENIVVGITPPPTIDDANITITDAACTSATGSITGITVSGVGPFSHDWNGGAAATADTVGLPGGSYTYTVTDLGTGCTATSGPYSVGVTTTLSLDVAGLSVTPTACDTDNGSITGIMENGVAPYQYWWNGIPASGTDTVGVGVGTYELLVTDANGCSDSVENIVVGPTAPPVIDSTAFVITESQCTANTGSVTGITVSGSSPFTYFWNGTSSAGIDLSNAAPGVYTLIVLDANGCSDTTGTYTIGTLNGPSLDVTALSVEDEYCGQANGSISGVQVIGGTSPYTYGWTSGSTVLDPSGLGTGSYVLTVTDDAGCSAVSAPINVGSVAGPSIDASSAVIQNVNCTVLGSITGINVSGGSGSYSYQWSSGQTTLDINGLSVGTYDLVVTDSAGCTAASGPYSIVDSSQFSVQIVPSEWPYVDNGECVDFELTSSGSVAVGADWTIGSELDSGLNIRHCFDEAGTIEVNVIALDANGCLASHMLEFYVLEDLRIPNVFTPNGDGVNEVMFIEGLSGVNEVTVSNRWGRVVYHHPNYTNDWNGKDFNTNEEVSEGVYFVYLRRPNGELVQFDVTVIR